jgi:hypothetical protein
MKLLSTTFLIFLSLSLVDGQLTFNLDNCSASLQNENATSPGRVVNVSGNLAYTYNACKDLCGGGFESNNFTVIVQQMTLWFLPYLTLLAQVPFATSTRSGDIMVSILTLGSPMLALYGLFVSLFNWIWIKDFANEHLDKTAQGSLAEILPDILGRLQQYPMTIGDRNLLASALALPKNRDWWETLRDHLRDRARRLDASGTAQLFLAGIVYIFAVVEAFGKLGGITFSVFNITV